MSTPPPLPPDLPGEFIPYAQPEFNLPFSDKRAGLKAWGIVFIIFGAIAGCFTLAIPLFTAALFAFPANQVPDRAAATASLIAATAIYACCAGGLIWLGIGSLRIRKWVRPVVLTLSALTIASAIIGAFSLLLMAPVMSRGMSTMTVTTFNPATATQPARPPTVTTRPIAMPPQAAAGMWVGVVSGAVFLLGLGVILPAAIFWFYRQQGTKLTLEYFDQTPRWTDCCPTPILGIVITAVLMMATILLGLIQQFMILPVSKLAIATLFTILLLVLLTATTILSYRRAKTGWGIAVATVIILTGYYAWLASVADVAAAANQFSSVGVQTGTSPVTSEVAVMQRRLQYVSLGLFAAVGLTYLAWCKNFFDAEAGVKGFQEQSNR